jgi:hydroxyacylglutathione hydrolase
VSWLIGFGSVVALLIVVACVYLMKMRSELRKMAPLPTGQIVDNIYAIRDGYVNFYLVQDRDQYIAIDAGKNAHRVGEELNKLNIDKSKVVAVLLTHTDRDHVGGLELFEKAKVHISEAEEALLNGTAHRVLIFGNKMSGRYEKIADNTTINFGDISVRSVLTPGHTLGSTCYVVNTKFLFTGDTLSLRNGYADIFSRLFNMDTPSQVESLKRISNLPGVRYLFTAHHGFTSHYTTAFGKWNR